MNSLNELLETASRENDHAELWYEALLQAEVFVITDGRANESEESEAKTTLGFASWEKPDGALVIPAYSSLEILQDCVKEDTPYLKIACLDFFSIVKGCYVMIDANESGGYEFSPEQLSAILNGVRHYAELKKALAVSLEEVEAELLQCFKKDARVKKAYLVRFPEGKVAAAIECEAQEYDEIQEKAVWVLNNYFAKETILEIGHVGTSPLAVKIAKDTEPFYRKKWLGIF